MRTEAKACQCTKLVYPELWEKKKISGCTEGSARRMQLISVIIYFDRAPNNSSNVYSDLVVVLLKSHNVSLYITRFLTPAKLKVFKKCFRSFQINQGKNHALIKRVIWTQATWVMFFLQFESLSRKNHPQLGGKWFIFPYNCVFLCMYWPCSLAASLHPKDWVLVVNHTNASGK